MNLKVSSFTFLNSFTYLLLLSIFSASSFAEGTKELTPPVSSSVLTPASYGDLQIYRDRAPFMSYKATENERLYITVCDPGEKIFIGLRQDNRDCYFRLRDPNGNIVLDNGAGGGLPVPQNGDEGYISTYQEAYYGPDELRGDGLGYDAIEFTPTMTGDYYIEFNQGHPVNINEVERTFLYFDVTVADASNTIQTGRMWSREWIINCKSFANRYGATMYIYSDDGIVTKLNFNGIQPYKFSIAANQVGTENTGNFYADRQSKYGNVNFPQYKIFLNEPDADCFPVGDYGELLSPVEITGCDPDARCITFNVSKGGYVNLLLDLNGTPGYQQNSADVLLADSVSAGENCMPWNSTDGLGNYVEPGGIIDIRLDYFNGITHLPLYDVEAHENGYVVEVVAPIQKRAFLFWDDSNMPNNPDDANVNLSGICDTTDGCHQWDSYWGDRRTINTWWYANVIETEAQYPLQSTIFVDANTFLPPGSTNDTTICSVNDGLQMFGSVTTAPSAEWTSSGTGTFDDINDLNTIYRPSSADVASGSVTLYLTTSSFGTCFGKTDSMSVSFESAPDLSVSASGPVCGNNPSIDLSGTFNNADDAYWIGNGGTFTPDSTNANAVYYPSQSEIDAEFTFIKFESVNSGACPSFTDSIGIVIEPEPEVTTGVSATVCENNSNVSLNGIVTNASGGNWIGGSGTFVSGRNSLITEYIPTQAEINADSLVLTLQTTGEVANCSSESESLVIHFSDKPSVEAGAPIRTCVNNASLTLSGLISGAGGGQWSTVTGGTFDPSDTIVSGAEYIPSQDEIDAGSFYLKLSSTGNGDCNAVSDSVLITIDPSPVVNAGGANVFTCANNPSVDLEVQLDNATDIEWTGLGNFVPNANDLTPTYTLTQDEIDNGIAGVLVKTINDPVCAEVNDTVTIFVNPAPEAIAPDTIWGCENNPDVQLSGSFNNATGFYWSGGDGTYSPNQVDLNAVYTATAAELAAGKVVITLNVGANLCLNETKDVVVVFGPVPTVEAGPDQAICENNTDVTLAGNVTKYFEGQAVNGQGYWTGNGGIFDDSTRLNAVYTPSQSEVDAGFTVLTLTSSDNGECNSITDQVRINFTPAPTAEAGNPITVCENKTRVSLSGSTSTGSGTWMNFEGSFNPNRNTLTTTYTPSQAEIDAGSLSLVLATTDNGNCNAVYDTVLVSVTDAPEITTQNVRVCEDDPVVAVSATVTNAGGVRWTGGSGFYENDTLSSTNYYPITSEINSGSFTLNITSTKNGLCNAVTEMVSVTIDPAPEVDAGANLVLCGDVADITLSGSVTNAGGGVWTHSGSGSFVSSDSILNAVYRPTDSEKLNRDTIYFTLTTTDNDLCIAVEDSMFVTFTDIPAIHAGASQTVCSNDLPIQLDGNGTPARWSGGLGNFLPDNEALNATYEPHPDEIDANEVTLTLTTIVNGACAAVADQVTITIPDGPVVNAGDDQTVCADTAGVTLNGTINFSAGGTWNTPDGRGSFNSDSSFASATTYSLNRFEIAQGFVSIVLGNEDDGVCSVEYDTMIVTILQSPELTAGPDQTFCGDVGAIPLSAMLSDAGGVQWTTNGDGQFSPSDTSLNASYEPGVNDILNGSVDLFTESTDNGLCQTVYDTVGFTLTPIPTAGITVTDTLCADVDTVALSGMVTEATGGEWQILNGTGNFVPDQFNLLTNYLPSEADRNLDSLIFIIEATGIGTCNPVFDTAKIVLTPAPTLDLGPELMVCSDSSVDVSAQVTVATSGIWSTNGTGTFADNSVLSTVYNPSLDDTQTGITVLTYTTTAQGICKPISETVRLNYIESPELNAGGDLEICETDDSVRLAGTISEDFGVVWSTVGDGNFISGQDSLESVYAPSSNDDANLGVTLVLSTVSDGVCASISDSLNIAITPKPEVNSGVDLSICADSVGVELPGTVNNALGGYWQTSGSGIFYPNNVTLNATYAPSSSDITNGSVELILTTSGNGACAEVTDTVNVTILPIPNSNAGSDLTVCSDQDSVLLSGNVNIATNGRWSTSSGTGMFAPSDSILSAYYVPSDLDKTIGRVTLSLETTDNGICTGTYRDNVVLNIDPLANVYGGGNLTVCADQTAIKIKSSIDHDGGVEWSSNGGGVFIANRFNEAPTYRPTQTELNGDSTVLTVTSLNNGVCSVVTDTVIISYYQVPTAEAGSELTICESDNGASLSGALFNVVDFEWQSSGSGSFFPSPNDENATYVPSADDIADSSVVLTIQSTFNGPCPLVSDSLKLFINPIPTVDAGATRTICSDEDYVTLTASLQNAQGVVWSTIEGEGTFGDSSLINSSYSLVDEDRDESKLTFVVTTTGNYTCSPVSDRVELDIQQAPEVDAGGDKTMCTDQVSLDLNAVVANVNRVQWETSGTGTFGDENSAATLYYPTPADTLADSLVLRVRALDTGVCSPIDDFTVVKFVSAFNINAGGPVDSICTNDLPYQLKASGADGSWSGGTAAGFSNPLVANPTYAPTPAEVASGSVVLTITSISNATCPEVEDSIEIVFLNGPEIGFTEDSITVCGDSSLIDLSATITNAGGLQWSSTGSGQFADDTALNTTYTFDAEDVSDSLVIIKVTSTDNGICSAEEKRRVVFINPIPTISAGLDQTWCADVDTISLSSQVNNAGGVQWTSLGAGSFIGSNTDAQVDYLVASTDSSNGSITFYAETTNNGLCKTYFDTVDITLTPVVQIDAGSNVEICEDQTEIPLNAPVQIASGGQWSTINGAGIFTPTTGVLNATYNVDESDITTGTFYLYATTTGNGTCKPVTDSLEVRIAQQPIALISDSVYTICAQITPIVLEGSVSISGVGVWSTTGTGSFSPNDSSLSAIYTPTQSDIDRGGVNIILESRNNDVCNPSQDFMPVEIIDAPVAKVNAGFDIEICADQESVALNGSVDVAGGGAWSTPNGSGSFYPNTSDLQASYVFAPEDTVRGFVTIVLTSTDNGICFPESDTITITITPKPEVTAGADQVICKDKDELILNGSYRVALGATWSTLGTGFFEPHENTDSVVYRITDADKDAGSLGFTLTTTGNGTCNTYSDNLKVRFTEIPTVSLIDDITICANMDSVEIDGVVTIAGGGVWSSNSSGIFRDSTSIATKYAVNEKDVSNGRAVLTLTSTDNGNCNAVSENLIIDINPTPSFDLGPDRQICADYDMINLNAMVENSDSNYWSTTGNGSFDPSRNNLSVEYNLTNLDVSKDSLVFTMANYETEFCYQEDESITVRIARIPTVDAEASTICSDVNDFALNVAVDFAGGVQWTALGNGPFSPSRTDTIVTYSPNQNDYDNGEAVLVATSTQNGTCQPVSDTVRVVIKDLPQIDAGRDRSVCVYDITNILGISNEQNVSFNWTRLNGDTLSREALISFSALQDTILVLRGEDAFGCENLDTIKVLTIRPPVFSLDDYYCFYDSLVLNSSPSGGNYVGAFQWMREGRFLFGENDPTSLEVNDIGEHTIIYSYEFCIARDTTEVKALPDISSEDKIICEGATTILQTTELDSILYEWSQLNEAVEYTDGNEYEISTMVDQTYTVQATDSFGCFAIDTIEVITVPSPEFQLSDSTTCEGEEIVLVGMPTNIQDTLNSEFVWTFEGDVIPNANTFSLDANESGTYVLRYNIGECAANASAQVTYNPNPITENLEEITACMRDGEEAVADAGPGTDYLWLADSSTTQMFATLVEGTYKFYVFNEFGCKTLDSMLITDLCAPTVYVPTAFVPGSGNEDSEFKIYGKDFEEFSITIFNRWGEVIFYSEDPDFGWDGTYRGDDVQSGVYPYVLKYKGKLEGDTGTRVEEGSVTIIR